MEGDASPSIKFLPQQINGTLPARFLEHCSSNTYPWALRCQVPTLLPNEITAAGFQIRKALPGFFLCIFSSLTWRDLFWASRIFCGWRYQPGSTGIFWPADGTSQPVTISEKWKAPSFERDPRTGPSVIFDLFPRLTGWGRYLKSRKGLYSGPSPVQNCIAILYMGWVPQKEAVLGKWKENTL